MARTSAASSKAKKSASTAAKRGAKKPRKPTKVAKSAKKSRVARAGASSLPATKPRAKTLRCAPGYEWKPQGRSGVALMRNNNAGVTLNCECDLSGGCKLTIDPTDPQTISCLNSGCTGSCGWVIQIPGLRGVMLKLSRARAAATA